MLANITISRQLLLAQEVFGRLTHATRASDFVRGFFFVNQSSSTHSSDDHHQHLHHHHHEGRPDRLVHSSSTDGPRKFKYVVSESFRSSACSSVGTWAGTCWEAFGNICDKLYSPVTVVAVTLSYIHLLVFIFLASVTIISGIPAKMLASYFYSYYASEYRLSPFAPVWFSLDDFPFSSLSMYVDAFVRLNTVLFLVIVLVSTAVYWKPIGRTTDLRFLLIFTTLLLCSFKMITIVSPQCYTRIMVGLSGEQMWNLMGEYKVVGADSVSCVFNMFMIIGKCCGVYGPGDFSNLPYNLTVVSGRAPNTNLHYNSHYSTAKQRPQWLDKNMTILFKVPAACCPQNRLDEEPDEDWASLRKCVSGQGKNSHYTKGCREAFQTRVEEYVLPILIVDDVATVAILVFYSIVHTMKLYNCKYRNSFESEYRDSQIECDCEGEEEQDCDDVRSRRGSSVRRNVTRTSYV